MHTFRVKKYSTLSISKDSSTKHYKSQQKRFKNKSLNDFQKFIQITSLKIFSIDSKQNQITQNQWSHNEVSFKNLNLQHTPQQKQVQRQIQTSRNGSQKIQEVPNITTKINQRNRMAYHRNRQKFVNQYGYIFNKNKKSENDKNEIKVQQTPGEVTQRLLSGIQSMKIEKSLQNRPKTSPKVNRSKKQQSNLNRIINQIEQTSFNTINTQSSRQKQLAKIYSLFQPDSNKSHHLNVQNLIHHLMRKSNKIYGKHHIADSVTWCQDVLSIKPEDEYYNEEEEYNQYQKYKNFLEELQKKRLRKRNTENRKKNTKQVSDSVKIPKKANIVFQIPFYCRKKEKQHTQI